MKGDVAECLCCGDSFVKETPTSRFCAKGRVGANNACSSKWHYQQRSGIKDVANCLYCGDEFKPKRTDSKFCYGRGMKSGMPACAVDYKTYKRLGMENPTLDTVDEWDKQRRTCECAVCGDSFERDYQSNGRLKNQKFCSEECRAESKRRHSKKSSRRRIIGTREMTCYCGNTFTMKFSAGSGGNNRKHCSDACRRRKYQENRPKHLLLAHKMRGLIAGAKKRFASGRTDEGAIRYLGYSMKELIAFWIERDWPDGLPEDWTDGSKWHIDHIVSNHDAYSGLEIVTMDDIIHQNRMENLRLVTAEENLLKNHRSGVDWKTTRGSA